jgi:hypothetical protein
MKKRINIGWIFFGIGVLVLGWSTIDSISVFNGWHLAFRISLNIVLLALYAASFLVRKNPN